MGAGDRNSMRGFREPGPGEGCKASQGQLGDSWGPCRKRDRRVSA